MPLFRRRLRGLYDAVASILGVIAIGGTVLRSHIVAFLSGMGECSITVPSMAWGWSVTPKKRGWGWGEKQRSYRRR